MTRAIFTLTPGNGSPEARHARILLLTHLREHFGDPKTISWPEGVFEINIQTGKEPEFRKNIGIHSVTTRSSGLRVTSFIRMDVGEFTPKDRIVKRHVYWPYRGVTAIE